MSDWKTEKRTCPKCQHTGPALFDFGIRMVRGQERAQSWCRKCRRSTSYFSKPRQYKTRNSSR